MLVRSVWDALQAADAGVCEALETVRRLSNDSTWQGCAETTEAEACQMRLDLLALRERLLEIQHRAYRN